MTEDIALYEVLVPTIRMDGRPIRTRFHRVWDAKVRDIVGGLTVLSPVKGQWVDKENNGTLYSERMIPVQIACTEPQFEKILYMTKDYYEQLKIFGFKLSTQVWIV